MGQSLLGFARHQLVGLGMVLTTLRMTHQNMAHCKVFQHAGRHFAGERPQLVNRQVLCTPDPVAALPLGLSLRKIGRRHASPHAHPIAGRKAGSEGAHQFLIGLPSTVHLPVAHHHGLAVCAHEALLSINVRSDLRRLKVQQVRGLWLLVQVRVRVQQQAYQARLSSTA